MVVAPTDDQLKWACWPIQIELVIPIDTETRVGVSAFVVVGNNRKDPNRLNKPIIVNIPKFFKTVVFVLVICCLPNYPISNCIIRPYSCQ